MNEQKQQSIREKRIRKTTNLYYSRPEIQKAIFEFSQNREVVPRYFEGFGKRPDSLQYKGDIFELVKKGATSFHCSEELWQEPLKLSTDMTEEQANDLRIGWDLLIDIDSKYFDYSKMAVESIIRVLKQHGIQNIGLKFSGSKGWHILIPWKAFPKEIAGIKTSDMFPAWPRRIIDYLREASMSILEKRIKETEHEFLKVKGFTGVRCESCKNLAEERFQITLTCNKCYPPHVEIFSSISENYEKKKCPVHTRDIMHEKEKKKFFFCGKCNLSSLDNKENFKANVISTDIFKILGLDIILVSPRHLFRMPYSLHEKTALASVVLEPEQIKNFELKDADPLKAKVKNFMPIARQDEASELLMQALDWAKENNLIEQREKKEFTREPIKLTDVSEKTFPPCIQRILQGLTDGQNRSLFALINLFRSLGMDRDEVEKRIYEWNKKNKPELKEGIIKSQISWNYRKKPMMPANCKELYQGIGVCTPDNFCNLIKNPVNYVIKKTFQERRLKKGFIKSKKKK